MKPARSLLSLSMKTIQYLWRQLLELLRFGQAVLLYALIFISVFFRNRASLGCELVAIRSQLTFYKENIRQKKQPRPRFTPAGLKGEKGDPGPQGPAGPKAERGDAADARRLDALERRVAELEKRLTAPGGGNPV